MTGSEGPSFHSPQSRRVALSESERRYVLSAFPAGATIVSSAYFDNYDLPCPVDVAVRVGGRDSRVVLRKARHGDVAFEARILAWLAESVLPVPRVLAPPATDDHGRTMTLLSRLPGQTIQKLGMGTADELAMAIELLVTAVLTMSRVRPTPIEQEVLALPSVSLRQQVDALMQSNARAIEDELCQRALNRLHRQVGRHDAPLVFSNGDYQAGNFLVSGGHLTGFLDFEKARLQDPLMGWAKYIVDDLHPLNAAGVVDRFLSQAGFDEEELAFRVAIVSLGKLAQLGVPPKADDRAYVSHIRSLLGNFVER